MSLKAVVFDVDGVLVQSMERHYEAYQHVFAELGVDIQPQEVYANEGRRSREVIASLAKERGIALDDARLDDMNARKQEKFMSFGPQPLYDGVPDFIAWLRERGFKVAAVTGTNRRNVNNHFGDLVALFDVIVTADDVERTKPDPEPYLAALTKLGVAADDAIVVENAPLGIRSAKAAGMRVAAVATTNPRELLHESDWAVASTPDVRRVVEELS